MLPRRCLLDPAQTQLYSQMPTNGVVFSDGIEADGLDFISGGVLTVTVADRTLNLVTGVGHH